MQIKLPNILFCGEFTLTASVIKNLKIADKNNGNNNFYKAQILKLTFGGLAFI